MWAIPQSLSPFSPLVLLVNIFLGYVGHHAHCKYYWENECVRELHKSIKWVLTCSECSAHVFFLPIFTVFRLCGTHSHAQPADLMSSCGPSGAAAVKAFVEAKGSTGQRPWAPALLLNQVDSFASKKNHHSGSWQFATPIPWTRLQQIREGSKN